MSTNSENISNIILVDKPKGITSYQCIRMLQQKFGVKKMGHAGTLDPLATGLLIIGVNEGTKRLTEFLKLPKVYDAEILLGQKTETGDVDGKILEQKPIPELSQEIIIQALHELEGTHEFFVPIYSAIKKQGKPLYAYARAGKDVDIPKKPMTVFSAELISIKLPVLSVRFHVGSGTYIRTLAEELGKKLGTLGTIQNLRRISIGDFSVNQAMQL